MRNDTSRARLLSVSRAGLIAALYVAVTLLIGPFGNAVLQCRISEALCILPVFTSSAIPGLAVGCLISNLITGCIWQDIVFGTLATLLGAVGAYLLRHAPRWLIPLPTVLLNLAVIPPVLAYGYRVPESLPVLFLSVGIGEVISAYVLGLLLLTALRSRGDGIFERRR